MLRGELAEAEASLRACIEESELWGYSSYSAFLAGSLLSQALTARGDHQGAAAALALGTGTDDQALGTTWHGVAHVAHLVATGRAAEALQRADLLEQQGRPVRARRCSRSARCGQRRCTRSAATTRRWRPSRRSWTARARSARRRPSRGRCASAARCWATRACRSWRRPSPSSTAARPGSSTRALLALGAALRRARRPADGARPAAPRGGAGRELRRRRARRDGARRALWRRARGRGRPPRTGVAALTPSERRVVGLAAEGQTNRDIAQALFVTPKTVEVHLSNAYRKLEVRSRQELRPLLEAAG